MKPIIIDMKEMSDSTEVYESRPHPFFIIFIYLILGLFLTALAWMYFSKIDIVVKSNGTFKMSETAGNVSSSGTGKVLSCDLQEGEHVEEGDLLFTIEHSDADKKLQILEDSLSDINNRLVIMDAYIKYIDGDTKDMESLVDNKYYSEFIDRAKVIHANIDSTKISTDNQISQYQQSVASVNESISYYQNQVASYNQAMSNVKELKNTFGKEDVYFYSLIENYIASYNSTKQQYDDKIKQFEEQQNKAESSLKSSFDETIKNAQTEKSTALKSLETKEIASLEQTLESVNGTILTLQGNLNSANAQLSTAQNGTGQLSNQTTILTEKNTINNEILTYQSKKKECESNVETMNDNINQCNVKATSSGYISMVAQLEAGYYVQEGTIICQIIPDDADVYYAEVYVSNNDIGKISENQEVKFEIAAYPSSEYGYFTGVIETISKDVKVDQNSGSAYYLAKVRCDKTTLYNKSGDNVSIMNGMACQAKIVTDNQSVLKYVLKKIDLID